MIHHELLRERGVLTLKPEGALRAEDFVALAGTVDPYIEQHGELNGLMIEAGSFPAGKISLRSCPTCVSYAITIAVSGASPWSRTASCLL